ncbi:MAG TPA: zf-HC2 domain-containing protein, partial [Anaerolineae bacterium]|nr:zf-HC2 domain-containing protein [Anaerolineae bacterium]
MKVKDRVHVTEQLPAYALGCLDEDEAAVVAQHLDACAACRAELEEYRQVAGRLAFAAPDAAPPVGLKQRIVEQVEAERGVKSAAVAPRGGAASRQAPGWRQDLARLFRPAAPAWGVAALALALLLVVSNVWWWQRAEQGVPGGGMRTVAMLATDAAP